MNYKQRVTWKSSDLFTFFAFADGFSFFLPDLSGCVLLLTLPGRSLESARRLSGGCEKWTYICEVKQQQHKSVNMLLKQKYFDTVFNCFEYCPFPFFNKKIVRLYTVYGLTPAATSFFVQHLLYSFWKY